MAPEKNENAERIGGPGASHENAKEPDKTQERGPHPTATKSTKHSGVSGGGGEPDSHHTRDPKLK